MQLRSVGHDSDSSVLAAIDEAASRAGRSAFVEDLGSGRERATCLREGAFGDANWTARTALALILAFISPDDGQPAAGDSDLWEDAVRQRALGRFDSAYREAAATDWEPHTSDPGENPVKLGGGR